MIFRFVQFFLLVLFSSLQQQQKQKLFCSHIKTTTRTWHLSWLKCICSCTYDYICISNVHNMCVKNRNSNNYKTRKQMKIIMHFNNTATTRTSCNLCRFFLYLFPCSNFLLNNFFQFFVLIFSPKIIYMQIFKTEFYNSKVNSQYVS